MLWTEALSFISLSIPSLKKGIGKGREPCPKSIYGSYAHMEQSGRNACHIHFTTVGWR